MISGDVWFLSIKIVHKVHEEYFVLSPAEVLWIVEQRLKLPKLSTL